MDIDVIEWPRTALEQYAAISTAFEVRTVFDVESNGPYFSLSERFLDHPYIKDFDAIKGNHILEWTTKVDLSDWGVMVAENQGKLLGGIMVSCHIPEVEMFEGRTDLAILWDIRVRPDSRGCGVGSALLHAAEAWAVARECRELKIESQNINVPACRFYERNGYILTSVTPDAYPDLPGEIQLLWTRTL